MKVEWTIRAMRELRLAVGECRRMFGDRVAERFL